MKHKKTFDAIAKLKDVEIELHRLKNALEMANRALDTTAQRTWVDLTNKEIGEIYRAGWANNMDYAEAIQKALKEKNT